MFDTKTCEKLAWYVYLLVDPDTRKPFYVGKGKDNRVFDHLRCALNEPDNCNLKYETIRAIGEGRLIHLIVRHGLTEKEALLVEASLIDVFDYFDHEVRELDNNVMTNLVRGHHSIEKGLMTTEEVKRIYNAEPLRTMDNNCVIININKTYKRAAGSDAIYQATKETWTMDRKKLKDIAYVLSEYKGLIVEVFKVCEWYEKERGYGPRAEKFGQTRNGFGFDGFVAEKKERDKYIGKSIAYLKKRGQANSFWYKLPELNEIKSATNNTRVL